MPESVVAQHNNSSLNVDANNNGITASEELNEQRFADAIAILLKRFGINEYSRELQEKVLGMEVARGIEEIIRTTGIPITVKEFMVMEREIYMEEMLRVELMPGAMRLVTHLKKHGIPMAIATGSTMESYGIKTKRHQDLFKPGLYFNHIVFTRDDEEVKNPKPAPDVYLITASRFPDKPNPSKIIVFEDSSIGVDGAIAAGMQCVMVPDHRFECKQKKATQILRTLEHFKPELYGLPPFDN
ncbi:Pseudouridine-5'-phosphatase [Blomia tropicalis]|nr:Pseudouridine-5'-phosphatase [Blomia tropicalis]